VTAKRFLLVDDEPANLSLLERSLAPLGHEIVLASGGEEALRRFAEQKPDIVLLDLRMPGLDGLDVLTHLRAQEQADGSGHVPVILVTAHADREHRLSALEAGADEFLEKPIDRAVLLARVRTLLRLKESQDALRESHEKLAARNRALEQLQREQRDLTAFVVHDLKNPLAAVLANLVYLVKAMPDASESLQGALTDAHDSAQRLRQMIEGLLLISRLEEPTFALQREPVSVDALLRDIASRFAKRAEESGVTIDPPTVPSGVALNADRNLLLRVVENILDNALRHTPRNGRVGVDVHGGDTVEITISNTGSRIPPSDRGRIFEKFARGGQSTAANVGLGLYFCRRVVEAHGGHIEVRETAEWPTSFVVQLPAHASALAP
jgi:two-component system, sensor histidine kinase and response regulator